MSCESLKRAIDAFIQKADNDLEDELAAAGFIDPNDTVKEITALEDKLAQALKQFTDTVLEESVEMEDLARFAEELWPKLKEANNLDDALRLIFLDELKTIMPDLVSNYTVRIDPEMTVTQITQRTTSWIESWSDELASIMRLNTEEEIERILTNGLKDGKSVAEFTQDLLDSGVRDEYYKARRAALTEVLTAHSAAQEEAIIQSPAVEQKEWVHTGAHLNDPRPNHVAMNGQIVPKHEPFVLTGKAGDKNSGTHYPMYPRDTSLPAGERINCHCIHRGIVNASVLGLPLAERLRLQAEAIAADDGMWEAELDAQNRAKAGIE